MRNEPLNQSNDFIQKLIEVEELVRDWKRAYKNEGLSIYQLKIVLFGTDPVVWRRIEIPSNSSLNSLSWAINDAMGGESYHLHLFQVSGIEFGASEDDLDEWENDKKLKVREAYCDNKTIMLTIKTLWILLL
jgi:hypothetical protein